MSRWTSGPRIRCRVRAAEGHATTRDESLPRCAQELRAHSEVRLSSYVIAPTRAPALVARRRESRSIGVENHREGSPIKGFTSYDYISNCGI